MNHAALRKQCVRRVRRLCDPTQFASQPPPPLELPALTRKTWRSIQTFQKIWTSSRLRRSKSTAANLAWQRRKTRYENSGSRAESGNGLLTRSCSTFLILSQPAASREAAYALVTYIKGSHELVFDPPFLAEGEPYQPPIILELGSGTGIVAQACADRLADLSGVRVIVTDLPEVCPLLEQNLHQQITASTSRPSAPKILVRPLTWGSEAEACAIATELGYLPSGQRGISPSPQYLTHVICSDLVRVICLKQPCQAACLT